MLMNHGLFILDYNHSKVIYLQWKSLLTVALPELRSRHRPATYTNTGVAAFFDPNLALMLSAWFFKGVTFDKDLAVSFSNIENGLTHSDIMCLLGLWIVLWLRLACQALHTKCLIFTWVLTPAKCNRAQLVHLWQRMVGYCLVS